MELPLELKTIIENQIVGNKIATIKEDASQISYRYRNENRTGKSLLTKDTEAISYAISRMPATYCAVYTALSKTFELYKNSIKTVLDVGAGTGAGSWAVASLLENVNIQCLEREDAMLKYGKLIMEKSQNTALNRAKWIKGDIVSNINDIEADLVICSYVLNEMNKENRMKVLKKLWDSANKVLLIIEPGTPEGSLEIREERQWLIDAGAKIIAPCAHANNCVLSEGDWCNTTCRVARTKLHKMLKQGSVPYEDEKFSYIAVCKENVDIPNIKRVLRHPKINTGRISLHLCTCNGIEDVCVTKKDKELFKIARKIKNGDALVL